MRPGLVMAGVVLGLATITGAVAAWEPRPAPSEAPAAPPGRPFVFGLWGDMPYNRHGDAPKIPALFADMNAAALSFSAFDGDTKDGVSPCSDDQYTAAVDRFNQLEAPAVYVPGDNEWTDCHHLDDGGYDNLERLAHLRRVMFAGPSSFGRRTMPLVHQGPPGQAYAENTRWDFGDAVFVGINVPGSNNNRVHDMTGPECSDQSVRTPAACAADNAEYVDRNRADIDWVHQAFTHAKTRRARAVMVIMQADPGFDLPETAVNERADPGHDGYTLLLDALIGETRAFAGEVVLVHGDTHFFKLDKPLVDQAHLISNFTRLETFGSPNIDWVKVTADPRSRDYFVFEPMVVAANRTTG